MLIIIDGPEKAGKTTLIRHLVNSTPNVVIRKWEPVISDREYLYALQEDISTNLTGITIWDRSWASEHVYCNLLNREGRLKTDPWFGEWVYGRISQAVGVRIMLLGPSSEDLQVLRTLDDHIVNVRDERYYFGKYGHVFNWLTYSNNHNMQSLELVSSAIMTRLKIANRWFAQFNIKPPFYAGPPYPDVLVLGEPPVNGSASSHQDSWVPFGSRLTTAFGRDLHVQGLSYGWSNIGHCPIELINATQVVLACGKKVQKYVNTYARANHVIEVPHPAWLYRFGEGLAQREETIQQVKKEIAECLQVKSQKQQPSSQKMLSK